MHLAAIPAIQRWRSSRSPFVLRVWQTFMLLEPCCVACKHAPDGLQCGRASFLRTQVKRRCRGERALDVPDGALAAPCQSTFRASEQTRSLARALWGFAGEGGSWGLIGKELSAGVRRLGSDCRPASPACAADEDAVRWATGARSSIDVSDFIRSELNA